MTRTIDRLDLSEVRGGAVVGGSEWVQMAKQCPDAVLNLDREGGAKATAAGDVEVPNNFALRCGLDAALTDQLMATRYSGSE